MIRLLCLDHGSRTGWACGDGTRLPALGSRLNTQISSGAGLEPGWVEHKKWLGGILRDFAPTLVVWEKPIIATHTSIQSLEIMLGLQAITGCTCRESGVSVRTVTVQQAKMALAGSGNADKESMVVAARAFGYKIEHHDEADALGVFLHTIRILEPELAHHFDPLFMTRS